MLVLHGIYENGKVEITGAVPEGLNGPVELIIKNKPEKKKQNKINQFIDLNKEMLKLNIKIKKDQNIDRIADEAFNGLPWFKYSDI